MMDDKPLFRLTFLGGASGVGKTYLLERAGDIIHVSTGTLFKELMVLASRDDVRKTDWSHYEEQVQAELLFQILGLVSLGTERPIVIDTHFGAKISGRGYRIGMRSDLITSLATEIFETACGLATECRLSVVLVTTDAHSLLKRRRLDRSRSRELVASDCVKGLKANEGYSHDYFQSVLRAENMVYGNVRPRSSYYVCVNHDADAAAADLQKQLKGVEQCLDITGRRI
jgi:adenylate kinase